MTALKNQNPILVAISGEVYESLLTQVAELERTAATRDDEVQRLLLNNLQGALKYEYAKSAANTVAKHLDKFLDEFEAQFNTNEVCASPEIAMDYINAAIYMKQNFNRDDAGTIDRVQEWYDNYKPWGA